jgi:hypothetical protein
MIIGWIRKTTIQGVASGGYESGRRRRQSAGPKNRERRLKILFCAKADDGMDFSV